MATDAPDPSRLAGLPPPVARYLQFALGDRLRAPAAVHLRQAGQLRTSPTSRRWLKFTADHTAAPGDCSFRWDARVAVAPLVHVRVSDSLAGGIGSGRVLLQSLVRIAHDAGTPEMNSGSLHRFLAEAVWYPWALLPGEHLRWQPAAHSRRSPAKPARYRSNSGSRPRAK